MDDGFELRMGGWISQRFFQRQGFFHFKNTRVTHIANGLFFLQVGKVITELPHIFFGAHVIMSGHRLGFVQCDERIQVLPQMKPVVISPGTKPTPPDSDDPVDKDVTGAGVMDFK